MKSKNLFVLLFALTIFSTSSCLLDNGSINVIVTVINNSNDPVHIWIDGQSIGPENKVYPDGNTTFGMTGLYYEAPKDEGGGYLPLNFTLYAGRDGETIHSQDFSLEVKEYRSGKVEISWKGSSFILK